MAELTKETVDIINGTGFNQYGTIQSPDDIARVLAYYRSSNNLLNANGDMIELYNTLLQQANREQDWERTNPQSVVRQLQAAGMSRAAALQAAAGSQGATTAVSPSGPAPATLEPIMQTAGTIASLASGAVGMYATLAQLPFDQKVKKATADLIANQSNMLGEQIEGNRLAAAFYQDAVNEGFDFKGKNASDVLQFLAGLGRNVDAFKRNPYALSQMSSMLTQEYGTSAQSYTPESAANLQRIQVATEGLIQGQALGQEFLNRHLWRQDDIEAACQELRRAANVAQAEAEKYKLQFDAKRFEKFYEKVESFTSLDLMQLDYNIQQLQYRKNLKFWEHETRALVNGYDYQAAQFLFAFHLQNDMMKAYEDAAQRDEAGFPQGEQFNQLLQRMVFYNTLDKQGETDNTYRWLRFGAGAAAGLGAGALATAKWIFPILKASEASAAAATAAANAAATATPAAEGFFGAPLNITAPFVVNRHLLQLMFDPLNNPMYGNDRIEY